MAECPKRPDIYGPVLREFDCLALDPYGRVHRIAVWVTQHQLIVKPYYTPCVMRTIYPWNIEHHLDVAIALEHPEQSLTIWGLDWLIREYLERT
jgi:hypothetical protein